MPPKFLADEDINGNLIAGIRYREPLSDLVSAADVGLLGEPDFQILEIAARLDRVVLSHDSKTMIAEFYRFVPRRQSPGLVVVPQRLPLGPAINWLVAQWSEGHAERFRDQVRYVSVSDVD